MQKNNRNNGNRPMSKNLGPRINEKIRIPEILLIDDKGEKIGVISTYKALEMARDKELDLVEISPNLNPPVCKLMDYGKYKFDLEKKQKESKKNQKVAKLKEIRIKYKTDVGDIEIKTRQASEFLKDGMKVKVSLKFKGREIEYTHIGMQSLSKLIDSIDPNIYTLESKPALEGRTLFALLSPKEIPKAPKPQKPQNDKQNNDKASDKANDKASDKSSSDKQKSEGKQEQAGNLNEDSNNANPNTDQPEQNNN